jgi:hypothetical protein
MTADAMVAVAVGACLLLWLLKTGVWLLLHKLMYGTWRDYPDDR